MRGPRLPRTVRLPPDPMIAAAHLRIALNASRAVIHRWRTQYNFPPSYRDGGTTWAMTAHVADWLTAHGVQVIR
jgi:hypothetical protein